MRPADVTEGDVDASFQRIKERLPRRDFTWFTSAFERRNVRWRMKQKEALKSLVALTLLGFLTGCAHRGVAIVQEHHAQEFGCDARFVRVEREPEARFVTHGCGFDADWVCQRGACSLQDARSRGTGAP
ncbi:MAG: hypothetical protein AB8I08_23860 [Sandaracinaceae bacterium]